MNQIVFAKCVFRNFYSKTCNYLLDKRMRIENARDLAMIRGSERSPEKGMAIQYCVLGLENSINRRTWWTTVHGVPKSWTQVRN